MQKGAAPSAAFQTVMRPAQVHGTSNHQGQGRQDGEGPQAVQVSDGQPSTFDRRDILTGTSPSWPCSSSPPLNIVTGERIPGWPLSCP
ncbi:hypothetical protein WJX84_001529 [Apatococcus fuscideae]